MNFKQCSTAKHGRAIQKQQLPRGYIITRLPRPDFFKYISFSRLSDSIVKRKGVGEELHFSFTARGLGLERLGEIRVHFGGEFVRAGEQGERCHPLREGVRIVESPVAPTDI